MVFFDADAPRAFIAISFHGHAGFSFARVSRRRHTLSIFWLMLPEIIFTTPDADYRYSRHDVRR